MLVWSESGCWTRYPASTNLVSVIAQTCKIGKRTIKSWDTRSRVKNHVDLKNIGLLLLRNQAELFYKWTNVQPMEFFEKSGYIFRPTTLQRHDPLSTTNTQ
jgi:hypothetical protein